MNNSGKGNGLMILLIPVFLIAILIVTDTVISYSQNKSFKNVTEEVIEEVVNNENVTVEQYKDEIKRVYERRGYSTVGLYVEADEDRIYVENDYLYFGLFTSFKKYGEDIEVKLFGIEYFTFRLKKASKTFVKVEVTYDEDGELIYEYLK